MQQRILVCDDDRDIVEAIRIFLEEEGYAVSKAYDGEQALRILEEMPVHLLLLDVMMPKLDGLTALRKIRQTKSIPIIVLSAKTQDADKILGLSLGADDYVSKPFNPLELVARVKSQLRRYTEYDNLSAQEGKLRAGGLAFDEEKRAFFLDGELLSLTKIEYKILQLLMQNPGRIFSSEEIYERVWEEEALGMANTVAVHIRHIREKIEIDPKDPRYVKVVWGIGYKLDPKGGSNGEDR